MYLMKEIKNFEFSTFRHRRFSQPLKKVRGNAQMAGGYKGDTYGNV